MKIGKANITPSATFQPEDLTDFELKAACEAWFFEHRVAVRGRSYRTALTARGFANMMAVEHAGDPERAWRRGATGCGETAGRYRTNACSPACRPRCGGASSRWDPAEGFEANRARLALQADGRRNG
ncbi:hypothetical protein AAE478_006110 [Parahypoxylon ruwenzoriense]